MIFLILKGIVLWFAIVYVTQAHHLDWLRVVLLYVLSQLVAALPLLLFSLGPEGQDSAVALAALASPLLAAAVIYAGLTWWLGIGTSRQRLMVTLLYLVTSFTLAFLL